MQGVYAKTNRPVRVLHVSNTDFFLTRLLIGKMKGLVKAGYEVDAAAPDSGFSGELKAFGIRFIDVPIPRKISAFRDYAAYRRLVGVIREGGYDIVHTHSAKAGFIGRLAAHRAGTRCILHTAHGLPFYEGQPRLRHRAYRFLERFAQKRGHLLLSQNREDMRAMVEYKLEKPERILYEGNGIDIEEVRREAALAPEGGVPGTEGRRVIGFFARIEPVKGHRIFLSALRELVSERQDVLCLMAGANMGMEDDYARRVMDDIRELGLERFVCCLGFRDDVIRLITLCDIVVLPSEKEGIPRVLMEAMALGKPVVATDVPGTRELVEDEKTGLLVPYGDPAALAGAMGRLLRDGELASRLREAARLRVEREFDERLVIGRLEAVYRDALERGARATPGCDGGTACKPY